MTEAQSRSGIDWRRYRPTRRRLWIVFSVWAAIAAATILAHFALSLAGRAEIDAGGDFIVFHSAAKAAADGAAAEIYDPGYFQTLLRSEFPGRTRTALSWQYPPTYLLFLLPFAAAPYLLAAALWSGATAAGCFAAVRTKIDDRLILLAMMTGPAAYAAFLTGQNGFLSAALLALAACYPRTRPILAGVAAGLLTVKPHLGLLIPVAFIAAGCWRAMAAAAVTALALAAASLLAFGAEPWAAFADAVFDTAQLIRPDMLPLAKMATPMSAALFVGAPQPVATAFQILCTLAAAVIIWRVWRRIADADLRAAALIACAFLASPYGFHYELIILALPVAIIAQRALNEGWLRHEEWFVGAAWLLPAAFGFTHDFRYGLSLSFVSVLIVFALVMRRIFYPLIPRRREWTARKPIQ